MIETIKSYLVSLGFAVDKSSYLEATKTMNGAEGSVTRFAGNAVTKFGLAAAAVTTFAATAVVGIAKFLDSLGKAEIETEKLARQMWTTEENAKSFDSTLKAMGATLEDLYLSPTLMNQFMQLRREASALQAPSDYKNQMRLVQSVTFEFKRMKLEGSYALQWIGYYLTKYLTGPIYQIKKELSSFNDARVRTMPQWTKVIAQVMSWFVQFGITIVRAFRDVGRVVIDVGQTIPKTLRMIGVALAALGLLVRAGPFGAMIAIFTAAILLLNDFYTYLDGGEAQFGPFWQKLIDFYNQLKDSGAIDKFKKGLSEAFEFLQNAVGWLTTKFFEFWSSLEDNGTIGNMKSAFSDTFDIIISVIRTVIGWIGQMYKALQEDGVLQDLWETYKGIVGAVWELIAAVAGAVKKFLELKQVQTILKAIGDVLTTVVGGSLKLINGLLKQLTSGLKVIADLFKGDFKGALENAKDFFSGKNFTQQSASSPSYIYPQSNSHSSTNNKVTLNQTNNIYGSDPKATANAAQSNFQNMMYTRNTKGAFTW